MKLLAVCPCGKEYHVEPEQVGKPLQCAICGTYFVLLQDGSVVDIMQHPSPTKRESPYRLSPKAAWFLFGFMAAMIVFGLVVSNTPDADAGRNRSAVQGQTEQAPSRRQIWPTEDKPQSTPRATTKTPPELNPEPLSNRTLPHGTNITEPIGVHGRSRLEIKNGLNRDAFVLLRGPDVRRQIYIVAKTDAVIDRIPPCMCKVLFASGVDWDTAAIPPQFTRNKFFMEFEKLLDFREITTTTEDGIQTTVKSQSITLHPVPDGNVRMRNISQADFEAALARY